jgi:excisionase family DNA binding protein
MRVFSVCEAAEELGVSAGTVYGLCARRKIRHQRIGLGRGTIRIPEDAIEEYRSSVTVAPEPAGAAALPAVTRPGRRGAARAATIPFVFLPPRS